MVKTKTKAKSKTATVKKTAKKKSTAKKGKEKSAEEIRKDLAKMVKSHAPKMAKAVIGESEKGDLARVKYMFELAHIYPASMDGSEATKDEECFAKTLLDRLDIPDDPVGPNADDEPASVKHEAAAEDKAPNAQNSDVGASELEKEPGATRFPHRAERFPPRPRKEREDKGGAIVHKPPSAEIVREIP